MPTSAQPATEMTAAAGHAAMPTLVAAGYMNIDMTAYVPALPGEDQRVTSATIQRALGGMSANLISAAAGLGSPWQVRCELITTAGHDPDSEWALDQLRKRGIGIEWIARPEGGRITYCLILVEPGGHRAIVSEPLDFHDEQVSKRIEQPAASRAPRTLHTDGYRIPSILPYVKRARELGWQTSVDLDGLPGEWKTVERLAEITRCFDIVFVNRGTASIVWPDLSAGEPAVELLASRLQDLMTNVRGALPDDRGALLLTLGELGALVAPYKRAPVLIPGTHVDTVDTTGAGDIFAGVFLAVWMNGESIEAAARYASAAAALSTTGRGAQGHLPAASEVMQSLGSPRDGT